MCANGTLHGMESTAAVLASGIATILIRTVDGSWPRIACGVIGYSILLLAYVLKRTTRYDVSTLRQCAYMFLAGTPSYTRLLDVSYTISMALATAGQFDMMTPFLAVYFASGLRGTSDIGFPVRLALALVFALHVQNPLIA